LTHYSYCYNYGTPGCSNFTGGSSFGSAYGYSSSGWGAWTWSGSTPVTMWNNATSMKSSDKYQLRFFIYLSHGASTFAYNLAAAWAASASASINMATLGNGATLGSITIT
jgi:hypothetical protein